MTVDERIKDLGFELVEQDNLVCYLVYENKKDDHKVEIDFNGEEFFLHSGSLYESKDWYGNITHEPMGMTYEECKAFLDKIDEMRSKWK